MGGCPGAEDPGAGSAGRDLGRAALLAVDEDPEEGLIRLIECLALELRLLISALGKYGPAELSAEDLWSPRPPGSQAGQDPEQNEVTT